MNSMIERVALAMFLVRDKSRTEQDWRNAMPSVREDFCIYARAGIEAMRNPTDEMLVACQRALVDTMNRLGWSKTQRAGRLSAETKSVMRWNAMIDASLAPKQEAAA